MNGSDKSGKRGKRKKKSVRVVNLLRRRVYPRFSSRAMPCFHQMLVQQLESFETDTFLWDFRLIEMRIMKIFINRCDEIHDRECCV